MAKNLNMDLKWTRGQKTAFVMMIAFAVALFGQLLFVGALNWDDDSNIFKNPYYIAHWWSPFWKETYFGLYVPVTSLIWQILYTLGNGAAWPYRVLNLALHIANIALVGVVLRFMAKRWNLKSTWALLGGVALFALHPMQAQTVSWISGGRDLLSAFFTLLSLVVFFGLKSRASALLATVCFACAVLSKPNTVVLPVLLPWLCYHFDREKLRRSLFLAGLWLALAGVSIGMTLWAQRDFLTPLQWWERLLIMGDTYTFYIQKLFFPYPLSANYNRPPEVMLESWEPWWRSALLGIALMIGHFTIRPREPRFEIFLVWFVLLLPVSGLVAFGYQKISTTADHYHYLPMAAVSATLLLAVGRSEFKVGRWLVPALSVVLFLLANARVQVWKSDENFFADMESYAPVSYSTAMGYSVLECEKRKNYKTGIDWSMKALSARPNDIAALANLAFCFFHARDWPGTIALDKYLDALDIQEMETKQPSAFSSFLASVGSAMVEAKMYGQGFQLLCHAYRIKPSEASHKRNLEIATALLQKEGFPTTCEAKLDRPRR